MRQYDAGAAAREESKVNGMTKRRVAAFAAGVVLTTVTGASAQTADQLVVREAWVREAAQSDRASGAYLIVENASAQPVKLVGAQVDGVGVVEFHLSKMANDRMSMEQVGDITIPARGMVELKPGGYHLMLFKLNRPFTAGTTAAMTLRFSNGIVKSVQAQVRERLRPPSP